MKGELRKEVLAAPESCRTRVLILAYCVYLLFYLINNDST